MCDYIYLDGYYSGDTNIHWDSSTNMLSWDVDSRRLKNKKENNKIYVSVEQIMFIEPDTSGETVGVAFIAELVTNLNLKIVLTLMEKIKY